MSTAATTRRRHLLITAALAAPPAAWGTLLLAGYAAQEVACDADPLGEAATASATTRGVVVAVGVLTATATVLAGLASLRLGRLEPDEDRYLADARHLRRTGLVLAGLFLLAIVFTVAASFVLDVCGASSPSALGPASR